MLISNPAFVEFEGKSKLGQAMRIKGSDVVKLVVGEAKDLSALS